MSLRSRVRHPAAPVLAMALVVAACGGGAAGGEGSTGGASAESTLGTVVTSDVSTSTDDGGVSPTTSTTVGVDEDVTEPPADPQLAFAMNDLAERLDVPMSDVVLVIREAMTWRDGSLGCPQPGMRYTQALVDGYKITLEVAGVTYAYHGRALRDPFLCENGLTAEKSETTIFLEPKEDGAAEEVDTDSGADD